MTVQIVPCPPDEWEVYDRADIPGVPEWHPVVAWLYWPDSFEGDVVGVVAVVDSTPRVFGDPSLRRAR